MELDHPGAARTIPAELMQQAQATWMSTARNVRISQLHADMSQLLTAMGIVHTVEHLTEGGLFSLDLAIPGEQACHRRHGGSGMSPLSVMHAQPG